MAKPINELFTRTTKVQAIGEPEIWSERSGRFQIHIYDTTRGPALVQMGMNRPGVRAGLHGIYTGGTKQAYRDWAKSVGYTRNG
jgi:hypothetical protein